MSLTATTHREGEHKSERILLQWSRARSFDPALEPKVLGEDSEESDHLRSLRANTSLSLSLYVGVNYNMQNCKFTRSSFY